MPNSALLPYHIVSELSEPITVSKTMAHNSFLVDMFKRE